MSNAQEVPLFSDAIKEPATPSKCNEGSGDDSGAKTEVKKTLFFFGQAGCLKLNSPVKTTATAPVENHNNHKTDEACSSGAKELAPDGSKAKEEDDEDNLLQKISEALSDESPTTENNECSTKENSTAAETQPNEKAASSDKKESVDSESLSKIRSKLMENIEQEELKIVTKDSSASEFGVEVSAQTAKTDQTDSSVSNETIAKPKAFSIVPYDDDSMSSSSQTDLEIAAKEKSDSNDKIQSASLPSVDESVSEKTANLSIEEPKTITAEDDKMEVDDVNHAAAPTSVVSTETEASSSAKQCLEISETQRGSLESKSEPEKESSELESEPEKELKSKQLERIDESSSFEELKHSSGGSETANSIKPEESSLEIELEKDLPVDEKTVVEPMATQETDTHAELDQTEHTESVDSLSHCKDDESEMVTESSATCESSKASDQTEEDNKLSDELITVQERVEEKLSNEVDLEKPECNRVQADSANTIEILEARTEDLSVEPRESRDEVLQQVNEAKIELPEIKESVAENISVNTVQAEEQLHEQAASENQEETEKRNLEVQDDLKSAQQVDEDEPRSESVEEMAEPLHVPTAVVHSTEISTPESPAEPSIELEVSSQSQLVAEEIEDKQNEVQSEDESESPPIDKTEETEQIASINDREVTEPNQTNQESFATDDHETSTIDQNDEHPESQEIAENVNETLDKENKESESITPTSESEERKDELSSNVISAEQTSDESKLAEVTAESEDEDNVETIERTANEQIISDLPAHQDEGDKIIAAPELPPKEEKEEISEPSSSHTKDDHSDSKIEVPTPPNDSDCKEQEVKLPSEKEIVEDEESDDDYDQFPQDDHDDREDSDKEELPNKTTEDEEVDHRYDNAVPVVEPICIKKHMEPLIDDENIPTVSSNVDPTLPRMGNNLVVKPSTPPVSESEDEVHSEDDRSRFNIKDQTKKPDDDEEDNHKYDNAIPVVEPLCIKKHMEPLIDPEEVATISSKSEVSMPRVEEALVVQRSAITESNIEKVVEQPNQQSSPTKISEQSKPETKPRVNDLKNDVKQEETPLANALDTNEVVESKAFPLPPSTRKRKISERKSISESDSEGNIVTDSVSHYSSEDEEVVLKKKPKMRGKTTSPRKVLASRRAAATKKVVEEIKPEVIEPAKSPEEVKVEETEEVKPPTAEVEKEAEEPEQTLQNFKFDYDETEDIAAKVAAIKTMISKDSGPKRESMSDNSDDEVERKAGSKRSRKSRGRASKRKEADSSSDEDSVKESNKVDSKRSKTQDDSKDQSSPNKKKRETGPKGLLKYIDTSLVIDTTENEAPVRQSRRIAQQKIREETERRQMEEKLLKQMKAEAEKKKKGPNDATDEDEGEEYQKEESSAEDDDETYKGSRKKKKSKIKPSDKPWQTSSSHSEHSESEDYMEHVPSDPGSPLFKSDHEFSPESDDEDEAQVQPLKRARTAKKLEKVASSDEDEDINPNHACQVCHKTDSPEWILLCDECDCGYHCSCLKPIIFLIPSGNWYCPLCCHKKLINSLSEQLTQLDTLIYNIETAELRKQRQKLAEINEQNILLERRKNRAEKSRERSRSKESSGSSESDNSSEDAPLKDYFYKLRKRNQTAAPSYRFNEYDDLINSAIRRDEMAEEAKGAGNLGRGKDISTIIDADNEEVEEKEETDAAAGEEQEPQKKENDGESSGSDVVRPKKIVKRKKKNRKLNNLDVSSDEEQGSDEDFKGTSSSDSEVDEEDLSMSSVSESSLDLPSKKSKGRNVRTSTRTREKRFDRKFINDGDTDSDDEPLIKTKRAKKKDSDEEEFDGNDDDDDEGSLAEEIDSEDLCDDTETSESSESNWPKKKKKKVASYDQKPRKGPKKNENEDKAFRAGISKKKALKKSDNESEASASGNEKGRRKTRGKKLLYLIEDDLDSDDSDGIKPGVKRPDTPPEEREMFVKKQEEIKRMLAAKDTEAAKKLAAPTIMPIHFDIEKPRTPSPLPFSNEPASLSTIPKNVIESAKALDTDYNRIKPIFGGQTRGSDGNLQPMNEEELAKMMEEEDFAQHQLKLAGEAIARKKMLELEAKEEEFAAYSKVNRDKEWPPQAPPAAENKKRSRKSKSSSEKTGDEFPSFSKVPPGAVPMLSSSIPQLLKTPQLQAQPHHPQLPKQPPQSLLANLMQQHPMQQHPPPYHAGPPSLTNDRPSVLSSFLSRPDMHPQHLKIHQPIPPEAFNSKNPPLSAQALEEDERKKGRRKKFTPLRTDLVEGNISKLAKLDPPSVIQSAINPSAERIEDKSKVPRPDHAKLAVAAPPQIFNPATNPTPSVITRLLQPHQRPPGPFAQGFQDVAPPSGENPNLRIYPSPEEMKNASPSKARSTLPPNPIGSNLPQSSFGENPFVPRNLHPLYRGPPGYGIPPHARLPPYPFHHLHPNLRPGEYPPYNIPPQFSYYAPQAHSRQPPQASAVPLNHGAAQQPAGAEDISNSIRNANNSDEPSETSEFGGLVSYFSSQQELD